MSKFRAGESQRLVEKAARAFRDEEFYRLFREGESALIAHRKANAAFERAKATFQRDTEQRWAEYEYGASGEAERDEIAAKDTELELESKRFVENEMRNIFNSYSHKNERIMFFKRRQQSGFVKEGQDAWAVKPTRNWTPIFDGRPPTALSEKAALEEKTKLFAKAKPKSLEFWANWDRLAGELINKGLGPRNAFEEQIEWTKQGKMWPYPIDNEWQFGPEADVPYTDHVFLRPIWESHNVPKAKAVEQFMELCLTGLSKNPYMTAEKKREHIAWFADYFTEAIQNRYTKLLLLEDEKDTEQVKEG